MNCARFQQVLADYIAGELAAERRAEARQHAAECRHCADSLAGLQSAAAVLDAGRLSDGVSANRADLLPVPLATAHAERRRYVPTWARYAAVITAAFTAGYALRGSNAAPTEARLASVSTASAAPLAVVQRYNSLSDTRPDSPTFTRTLLALAAPARSK